MPCRKSTTGSVLVYGGFLVSWKRHKQDLLSLSITESEIIELMESFKEKKSVQMALEEFDMDHKTSPMMCDNQAAIKISHRTGYSGRARHIEIRFLVIQKFITRNKITSTYFPPEKNRADCLTKSLPPQLHLSAVKMVSLVVHQ